MKSMMLIVPLRSCSCFFDSKQDKPDFMRWVCVGKGGVGERERMVNPEGVRWNDGKKIAHSPAWLSHYRQDWWKQKRPKFPRVESTALMKGVNYRRDGRAVNM